MLRLGLRFTAVLSAVIRDRGLDCILGQHGTMDSSLVWRIILTIVIAWLAIKLVLWLLGFVIGLVQTAVIVAVIIGIVYLLYAIFSKQKRAY